MRILLARHAETPWNAEGRYQGQIDIPLSATGRAQAKALGQRLKNISLTKAVASPLSRTQSTAKAALGVEREHMLQLDPGFMEIAHGQWEGKLASEIQASDPQRLHAWHHAPDTVQMPSGESLAQVLKRSWQALISVTEELDENDTLLIVAHDAVNRVILCNILGLPLSKLWSFRQAPATLNLLEGSDAEHLQLVRLNDCAHHTEFFGEATHKAL